ncbi:MAG: hypothetical protein BWY85_02256 [Firmicutes bacterium ADurb.Bin506]|nr:MAG: hypothetical protein BWY85_02256 [Firmicutes bacterium ADurb.Bin506]
MDGFGLAHGPGVAYVLVEPGHRLPPEQQHRGDLDDLVVGGVEAGGLSVEHHYRTLVERLEEPAEGLTMGEGGRVAHVGQSQTHTFSPLNALDGFSIDLPGRPLHHAAEAAAISGVEQVIETGSGVFDLLVTEELELIDGEVGHAGLGQRLRHHRRALVRSGQHSYAPQAQRPGGAAGGRDHGIELARDPGGLSIGVGGEMHSDGIAASRAFARAESRVGAVVRHHAHGSVDKSAC